MHSDARDYFGMGQLGSVSATHDVDIPTPESQTFCQRAGAERKPTHVRAVVIGNKDNPWGNRGWAQPVRIAKVRVIRHSGEP